MATEIFTNLINKIGMFELLIAVVLSISYCHFIIKYCLKFNKPSPKVLFSVVGWLNTVFGVLAGAGLNLIFGLIILFYRMVILPQKFAKN